MKKTYILLFTLLATITSLNAQSFGQAVCFDGFNDYVPLSSSGTGILGNNSDNDSFTIEFWLQDNPSAGGNQIITKHSESGTKKGYFIDKNSTGGISVGIANNTNNWSTVVGSKLINDGNWHYIIFIYNATLGEIKLYVDSALQGTTNGFTPVFDNTTETRIGSSQFWNTYFAGTLDEIRIWNSVRTATELLTNRAQEITTITSDMVLYYKCNEGMAYYDNWLTYQFIDSTGNGHTGDMYNMNRFGACSNWVDSVPDTTLSVDSIENMENKLSIYPNPANNVIKINGLKSNENYTIYNIIGLKVKSGTIANNQEILINDLTSGVYLFKLENNKIFKFVKK